MRKRFARLLAVSIFPVLAAVAQPDVTIQALNSAVVRGPSTLGSGIAQGSIFTIYGSGLGPSTLIGASTFPLPAQLGGSSVKVTVNGTQVDAIILAAAGSQINAILPSNTPLARVPSPSPITVKPARPPPSRWSIARSESTPSAKPAADKPSPRM